MALIAQTNVFKGKLLELIGLTRAETFHAFAAPAIRIEGQRGERFIWTEDFVDESTGGIIRARLMVRFLDHRAWAVGIQTEEYLFVVNAQSQDPFLEAQPQPPNVDPMLVNWVCRDPLRNYYNHGVGY